MGKLQVKGHLNLMFYMIDSSHGVCVFVGVWRYLQREVFRRFSLQNNEVNVIVGPVFDYDYDGLRDKNDKIIE